MRITYSGVLFRSKLLLMASSPYPRVPPGPLLPSCSCRVWGWDSRRVVKLTRLLDQHHIPV